MNVSLQSGNQQSTEKSEQNSGQTYDLNKIFEDRKEARQAFIDKAGWGNAKVETLGEDCAFRRYYRLTDGDKTALVMDSIKEMEDTVAPSHKLIDFVNFAPLLRQEGIIVPDILDHDPVANYALIEDMGDCSFNAALKAGEDEKELYIKATEILTKFRESQALDALPLRSYYDTHVHANRVDIVHWYRPAATYETNPTGMLESYIDSWDKIEQRLPECPQKFTHCDYHVDNLMVLNGGHIGVLDFQGAVKGPLPYDLANLLEDARKTLPNDLKANLKSVYLEGMSREDADIFNAWYRVLATQFHCRVIGLFVRLLVRDNKDMHLHHVPRLQSYISEALNDPILTPLKTWFDEWGIDVSSPLPDFDLPRLRKLLGLV